MSKALKSVILLFILVIADCKLPPAAVKEIIHELLPNKLKKISCGNTMLPEVDFNVNVLTHQPDKASETFCKAAKALETVPACQSLNISGLRVNLVGKRGQNTNCTVNDDVVELKYFLKRLRKFSQGYFSALNGQNKGFGLKTKSAENSQRV